MKNRKIKKLTQYAFLKSIYNDYNKLNNSEKDHLTNKEKDLVELIFQEFNIMKEHKLYLKEKERNTKNSKLQLKERQKRHKMFLENKNKFYVYSLHQRHFFHIVTLSPQPLFTAIHIFFFVISVILYLHSYGIFLRINDLFYFSDKYLMIQGLINIIFVISLQLRDIIREGTYEGMHTKIVQKNLKFGFFLFIITEVMFFFGFFQAFFHVSLSPAIELGCIQPPVGITPINPFKLPLLNTLLLLQSGIYITLCHMQLKIGKIVKVLEYFVYTLICGIIFTLIQIYEYIYASFTIADSVYGSIFYLLTGFHGFHVFAGSIFISVCFIRTLLGHFTKEHHVGFECAAQYQHFVDVVQLFLFIFVYIQGNQGFGLVL